MFGAASGFLGSQGFNDFSTNAMTANQKAPNKEGFA
jgi:hypothetical protein